MLKPGTLTAADYRPPRWLRNPHVQSVLGTSSLRRRHGERSLDRPGRGQHRTYLIDGGDGVRLQGLHSAMPDAPSRAAWCCCCTAGKAASIPATCA